jgi:hypothetical protein
MTTIKGKIAPYSQGEISIIPLKILSIDDTVKQIEERIKRIENICEKLIKIIDKQTDHS